MIGHDASALTPLLSTYADDQAISEILPIFLNNLPRYVADLSSRVEQGDWVGASRVCHDLKGTAGGYGYPEIGRSAQDLETELKGERIASRLEERLLEVQTLCLRARIGMTDEMLAEFESSTPY